ncbi:MAG TPA: TVP38/TMEM64 family protein [Clostridiales bacterium]|nr:TVP38/TMEM64 family protein [Clostridiales bacterium]
MDLFRQRDKLKEHVESRGAAGVLIFISFQVLQIVVAAIPGEVVQIAGGYMYGPLLGTLYLVIGVIIGSAVVFCISRLLGYEFVRKVVPQELMDKLYYKDNGKKFLILALILFLIPGVPKDVLTYIAGLTPVKAHRFLLVAVLGRLPALIASTYIGDALESRNYVTAVVLFALAAVLFLVGFVYKDILVSKVQALIDARKQKD